VIWTWRRKPLVSRANITTEAPERYAKQLISHLGRKVKVTETSEGTVLEIGSGRGTVTPGDGVLVLTAEATSAKELTGVQDVLARHLLRFATHADLTVTWSPAIPTA
jgi:hypothetical protein